MRYTKQTFHITEWTGLRWNEMWREPKDRVHGKMLQIALSTNGSQYARYAMEFAIKSNNLATNLANIYFLNDLVVPT